MLEGACLSTPASRAPGVLLLHGVTGTPTEMRPLEQRLLEAGYRVALPLLPGHGAGHRELLATTWTDWLQGVEQAVQMLVSDCGQVVVVGLSASALLAAMAAADEPRIRGLVLLSVHLGYPGSKISRRDYVISRLMLRLPRFVRRRWYFYERPPYGLKDERLQQVITRAIASSKRGESPQFGLFRTYAETLYQIHRLERACRLAAGGRVRCPTLLIHSLEDTMLSFRNAAEMYHLLGARDKSVELITGCDHVMTVDLCKDEVARRVESFLNRITGVAPELAMR